MTRGGLARERRRFRLQPVDDRVDLPPGAPHLRVELFGQLPPERFLALLERLLALPHPRLVGLERLPLARGQPMLVLERAHVAIDLREVLGQLRFARAQVLARCGDDRGAQPEPRGDFERQAPSGRSVQQLVGRRERLRD